MSNRNTVASNAAKIETINEKLDRKAETLETVNARLVALEAEDEKLKAAIMAKDAELSALKSELAEADNALNLAADANLQLKGEIVELQETIKSLEADKGKQGVSSVPANIDDANENMRRLRAENLAMELELTKRGIRKPTVEILPESAFMEIVYAPANGASRFHSDLVFGNGERYSPVEKEGFLHFTVPKQHAHFLLGTENERPYKYVGPDDAFTFVRVTGRQAETITVPRYVLDTTLADGAFWKPVEVEESKGAQE